MRISIRTEYLPTRRQIAAACLAIRQSWTPAERRRRTVGYGRLAGDATWSPPHIATSHCVARVRKMVAEASA